MPSLTAVVTRKVSKNSICDIFHIANQRDLGVKQIKNMGKRRYL